MTITAMPVDPRMERNGRERDRTNAMSASVSSASLAAAATRGATKVPARSTVGAGTASYIWACSLGHDSPVRSIVFLARPKHNTARCCAGPGHHGPIHRAVPGPHPRHVG